MASLDFPRLRPLAGRRERIEGREYVVLEDPAGIVGGPVAIPLERYVQVVRHFDGRTSVAEIRARALRESGQLLTAAELDALIDDWDRSMLLDGPTFAGFLDAFRRERTRPASHAGLCYPATERALRDQLGRYFADPRGAGLPENPVARNGRHGPPGRVRAVLSPHIDFGRGGPTYTWAYRELVERSDARVFVILGVAHQPTRHRFVLTRKDFETPLGVARTDRASIDRLAALAGEHLFDDELAHRTEHSIEFQVLFLQYLLGGRRDFRIVPILVGSFHDLMAAGVDPIEDPEVRRFVEALRSIEAEADGPVAYIGGIDLAHIGPEFGDPGPILPKTLTQLRAADSALIGRALANDPAGWFGEAAAVGDRWRVCGLAATYTLLHAIGPAPGRLLRYDQAVDARRTCCVSFVSAAFDESGPAPAASPGAPTAHD